MLEIKRILQIAEEMGIEVLEINTEKKRVDKLEEVNKQIKQILIENNVTVWMNYGDCGADFVLVDKDTNEELYIEYEEWGK